MSGLKVYEVEATTMLRHTFEIDAKNRAEAEKMARKELEKNMAFIGRDRYDTYDIDIEQVEESEGH
jgi:hypothetical protein